MSFRLQNQKGVFFQVAVIAAFCFVLNSFLSYEEYTLIHDDKWRSTKAEMTKGCGSSIVYLFTKTALSQNHLNISLWNGYQELIYKKMVELGTASFTYYAPGDFLSFIISQTDSIQYGIRFRGNKTDSSFVYTADKDGRFLTKQSFTLIDTAGQWNRVLLNRKQDAFTLSINDSVVATFNFAIPSVVQIGFKGGNSTSSIDDFVIKDTTGKIVVAENFSPPFKIYLIPLLLAVAALLYVGSWLTRRKLVHSVLFVYVCVLAGLLMAYAVYFFWLSPRYPVTASCTDLHGMKSNIETENEIRARLKKKFPPEMVTGKKKVILFIGSSQTWGSGASTEKQTMPSLIEKNVQQFFADTNIIVINTGIPGFTSNLLYNIYSTEWHKYQPVLMVINLSCNDVADTTRFKKSMEDFLVNNKKRHIATVLIQEPNDFAYSHLLVNHAILDTLAQKYGVELISMQPYMDSLKNTGFLWWDYVHCTNYGYQLMAARITPVIINVLKKTEYEKSFSYVATPNHVIHQ